LLNIEKRIRCQLLRSIFDDIITNLHSRTVILPDGWNMLLIVRETGMHIYHRPR